MSLLLSPKPSESIDQVIQSSQWTTMPHVNPSNNHSGNSFNRTTALSPPSPLASHFATNVRKDNMSANRRPSSRDGQDLRAGPPSNARSDRGTKDRHSMKSLRESDDENSNSGNDRMDGTLSTSGGINGNNITDFFGLEVFRLVLHNPTTAHRLLRFCQSRACGENMEFLQKVDKFNRLLDEASQLLGTIQTTYTSADAPKQINISHSQGKRVNSDIRHASQFTIPGLENIFLGPQEHIEKLLAQEIYPRFVKHQVTASATSALADHRERFQGLGDCFCLTDPSIADNPITYASDGFIAVTGYNRKDIIPRNCRFLQGELTDPSAPRRLRTAIDAGEETVELLLNYRKNGDPFWNLLYVSPLLDERGEVSFFLGGQINCSTTIHSCNDILRILGINDDELDEIDSINRPTSIRSRPSSRDTSKVKSTFFKSWRKYNPSKSPATKKVVVMDEAGQEPELVNKLSKMTFTTQVEAFYTAYSKYIFMEYQAPTQTLSIRHYSPGIIDILCLNLPNGSIAPIYNKDIFKVLSEHTSSSNSSSVSKVLKYTVREALQKGNAVSVETGILTGFTEVKGGSWFSGEREKRLKRVEERYVTHWTPLKDAEGCVKFVILSIAPKD
ncbi:Phototropin [Lachnellula occidentalis]|uniref:Phototropin n=1 Tax=Lachnellula occidentalis TaxID=215460 RepID=A0A8H8RIH0_9HELO|nr:Phototropin [Lachnellula occidentalis]